MDNASASSTFELQLRPVYDFELSEAVGFQSQLRIIDSSLGVILPGQYMPMAEQSARGGVMFKYWFKYACEAASDMKARNVLPGFVSVYLPLRAVAQKDFIRSACKTAEQYGVGLESFCFELMPIAMAEKSELMLDNLKQLRKGGARLAITDFGSEFSPTTGIGSLSEDYIFLSTEFAYSVPGDKSKALVAQSVIELAHKLNKKVVVDGIDHEQQAFAFLDLGCSLFLGDYFGAYAPSKQ